jgi:GST-like protein
LITFYSVNTANGQKAAIALEEAELAYEMKPINLQQGEHLSAEFLAVNPVGRAPVIVDEAEDLVLYGTMPIAIYAAEHCGRMLPAAGAARARAFDRAAFVASDMAAAFSGQFVFSVIFKEKLPSVIEFYEQQVHRMVGVMDQYLGETEYLAGDEYTIADVLGYPQAATSLARLPGALERYPNIQRWCDVVAQRPAVARGMAACTS